MSADLAGPDTDTFGQLKDEDLTIADFLASGSLGNSFDGCLKVFVVDGDLQLDLSEQGPNFLMSAVDFGNTLLTRGP
jgi:hypothetical protein